MQTKTIIHSQPFVTSALAKKNKELLADQNLQSMELLDIVISDFKKKFNLDNLFLCDSGSHALYWIIRGLGFTEKDEVIIPTYLCSSVYKAILAAGAKPVLCDTDSNAIWHISPQTIESKITKNTKAIIVVNLFGMHLNCTDLRYPGIILINDLCQSLDVLRNPTKDHGDFAFYSFQPTKFITAGSGGGFSVINADVKFKNFLHKDNLGFSISNMNLLILQEQLELYDTLVEKRKKIADFYFSSIEEKYTRNISKKENSFYRFPLLQDSYDFTKLQDLFNQKQIAVRRGVDQLIHRIVGLPDDNFPNAVITYDKTLSVPIYPALSLENAELVTSILREMHRL